MLLQPMTSVFNVSQRTIEKLNFAFIHSFKHLFNQDKNSLRLKISFTIVS